MPTDLDKQSEWPGPTPEDWKRAALELNPPPSGDYPTGLVVWMVLNAATIVIPAVVLLLIWLVRKT